MACLGAVNRTKMVKVMGYKGEFYQLSGGHPNFFSGLPAWDTLGRDLSDEGITKQKEDEKKELLTAAVASPGGAKLNYGTPCDLLISAGEEAAGQPGETS